MESPSIRCATIAVLLLAQISTVGGLHLPNTPTSTASLTKSLTSNTSPPTVLLSTTRTEPSGVEGSHKILPLYLPLTTAPPDPLGIASISGTYGPGTWTGWFCTLFASWVRLIRAPEKKIDPNTWAFLIYCNWAAVDVLRSIYSIVTAATPVEARSKFGPFAAAFTIVFWGTVHAFAQFLVTMFALEHSTIKGRRLKTLAIGTLLPVVALQAAGIVELQPDQQDFGSVQTDYLPVLYWHSMSSLNHWGIAILASWAPPIIMLLAGMVFLAEHAAAFAPVLTSAFVSVINLIYAYRALLIIMLAIISCSSVILAVAKDVIWLYGTIPVLLVSLLMLLAITPLLLVLLLPVYCVIYVFKGYFGLGSNVSSSCFFMPCAPQSLRDSDQQQSMVTGIILCVAFDLYPVISSLMKNRYRYWRENKASLKEADQHLTQQAHRRLSTPEVRRRNTPGTVV